MIVSIASKSNPRDRLREDTSTWEVLGQLVTWPKEFCLLFVFRFFRSPNTENAAARFTRVHWRRC